MKVNISSTENNCTRGTFFTLQDSAVTLDNNGVPMRIPIKQITNVRLIKQRNFALNLFTFLSSLLIFFSCMQFFAKHDVIQGFLYFVIFCLLVVSFYVRRFTYKLLINKGRGEYSELQITKNKLACARYFMTLVQDKMQQSNSKASFNYAVGI